MKKLTLKALELGATHFLTREQLKHVVAGSGGGSMKPCNFTSECPSGEHCYLQKCVTDSGSGCNCPVGWRCNGANICVYG